MADQTYEFIYQRIVRGTVRIQAQDEQSARMIFAGMKLDEHTSEMMSDLPQIVTVRKISK